MANRPFSQRNAASPPKGFLTLFALVFLIAGGVSGYFLLLRPMAQLAAAQAWTEAQCTVLSSRVEASGSGSSTYAVDIHYLYSVEGIPHESKRYDFIPGSSSGSEGKQAIVDRYPPGARVPCWFDPADPSSAVLSRGLSPVYLLGLFPLPFLLVGGGVLWLVIRPAQPAAPPAAFAPSAVVPASAELRPTMTPLGGFLVLTLLALFWNGLVSVFVWQAIVAAKAGQTEGCLVLFLLPFVLIGLGLIFAVVRQFLVLFNPRLHLTLAPGELTVGRSAFLQWRLGSAGRGVRRVKITLEARKETQTGSGSSRQTRRETLLTVPVTDSSQPAEIEAGGSATFAVPAGSPPSFRTDPDPERIVWALKAHCDVGWWPDSDDDYEVVVRAEGNG